MPIYEPGSPEAQAGLEDAAMDAITGAGAPAGAEAGATAMEQALAWMGQSPGEGPLTVAEAAERENVSERTIRRRLSELVAMQPPGAYKQGRVWRIMPVALDDLREVPAAPPKAAPPPSRRRRRTRATPVDGERWEV